MRRDHKYQAWYKEKMYEVFIYRLNAAMVTIALPRFPFSQDVIPDAIIQYTGLKDRNKKEIYEGDILKIGHYIDDDCTIHEVEYCGHRDYPAFELKPDVGVDSNGLSWAIANATIFEIIGNIYENPELL